MTHLQIFKTVSSQIPHELLAKYEHLSYGDMAELPEFAAWSELLLRAEEEWARADVLEAVFS